MRSRFTFGILLCWYVLICLACESSSTVNSLAVTDEASLAPNFFTDNKGQHYISWLATPTKDKAVLYFAKYEAGAWTDKQMIAQGDNWFVNWADFPSVTIHSEDEQLWIAHWLQYTAAGTYDYEIRMSISQDAGETWGASFVPHLDGIPAEHGFVSVVAEAPGFFKAVWLDGRFTKGHDDQETSDDHGHETSDDHGHDHGGGSMTLRTARIDAQGTISESLQLDDRVCDCCQTTMTNTSTGTLVLYRDRSENEIRDISLLRTVQNKWTAPSDFSNDNWEIAGCPVNGPVLRSHDNFVVAAWYTQANQEAKVKLAISTDAGLSYDTRLRVDEGDAMGRVDLALLNDSFLVSWVEATAEDGAEIIIKKMSYDLRNQQTIHRQKISPTRASGFPQLMPIDQSHCLLAWTGVIEESTTIRTSIFKY